MEDTMKLLLIETKNVDDEVISCEKEAAKLSKELNQMKKKKEESLVDLAAIEGKTHIFQEQFKKCSQAIELAKKKINVYSQTLAKMEHEEEKLKKTLDVSCSVEKFARIRMNEFEDTQRNMSGKSAEEKELAHLKKVVTSLKNKQKSFHRPEMKLKLYDEVKALKSQRSSAHQQSEEQDSALKEQQEDLNRVLHDIRVYEHRNQDHEGRTRAQINQALAHNDLLASELSQWERKVSSVKDTMEGQSH